MASYIVSTPTHERCVTSYAARTQYKPGVVHPPHIKVKDAIDIHCHAHEGQQDPFDLARRASLAEMKGLLFKSIPGDDPVNATQAVQDDVNRWAEKENGREQAPRKWDENPLPQVLPDIGLRGRDAPRSDSAADAGDVALRRVPPSRRGLWGQGLTVQILLMLTELLEGDCSETFTG